MITVAPFCFLGVIIGLAELRPLTRFFYGSYAQTFIFGIVCAPFLTRGYERVDWIGLSNWCLFSSLGRCFISFISFFIWLDDRLAVQEVLDVVASKYVPSISPLFSFFAATQLLATTQVLAEFLGFGGFDLSNVLGGSNPMPASADIAHHHVEIGVVFLVAGHLYLINDLDWINNVDSMLTQHVTGLLGLGSVAWDGHFVHVSSRTTPLPQVFILTLSFGSFAGLLSVQMDLGLDISILGGLRAICMPAVVFSLWASLPIPLIECGLCALISPLALARTFATTILPSVMPALDWINDLMLNHHLAGLLGLGSVAWDGHFVHVSLPINDRYFGIEDPLLTPRAHVFITSPKHIFPGGINPITASLWLTDIAHHHVAIDWINNVRLFAFGW